ncbi:hypothetical protein B0H66DRAFT_637377 [Apodospora peruviana]|uniref:UBX domain-containing protein 1 n=1 Tax=Apodospora peruviana TaxID=516989 RepID=A0AAE0IJP8_9PEZI|nr:hypothetical protein B0H66DRAFT_637377 [Apodospora peruviana]
MSDHDTLISSFCELTGASAERATQYLSGSHWDMDTAVTSYYTDAEEVGEATSTPPAAAAPEPEYTGPRTLDGRPAPQYAGASSSSAAKKPQKRRGLATLSSIGGGHNHDDDDEDETDDEEEDDRRRNLFAGGEKSGLAVQDPSQPSNDPRRLINDIVAKAKANARQDAESSAAAGPSRSTFRGSGQTLGGDGVESRTIPDPRGSAIPTAPRDAGPAQERILHIWTDGFSIDDGELRRFDDPENQQALEMIRGGRAPLHMMNVRFDQKVDVKLQQHNEAYRPLPKIYRPFGGEGRRLGSPVPGDGSTPPPPTTTTTNTTSQAAASGSSTPSTGVDESQPTLMLRIQLPDGTRLPGRFNTSQTVADVYEFVQRVSPVTSSRGEWVLSTTFPNKDHTDRSLVLGQMAEFKRGGTAVVKWA